MGIRFSTNTWRAPLQLIDCWLPAAADSTSVPHVWPLTLRRFARAGWLGRTSALAPEPQERSAPSIHATDRRPRRVRMSTSGSTLASEAPSARMVISGRIADVCDELDRLAALEQQICASRN